MNKKSFLFASLFASLFAASVQAKPSESERLAPIAERADARAEEITDAEAFLIEIDDAIALAENGHYGRLKRGASNRLLHAQNTIQDLLQGHATATELPPEERIALFNAQETITAIIRNDDKGRIVCQRKTYTGSRVPATECETIAEIEARQRESRFTSVKVAGGGCAVGEGSFCEGMMSVRQPGQGLDRIQRR